MKFVSDSLKHYWKRIRDFCVFKVLHADDPPHRLALGIAIGSFVTLLPLIGIQMVLSVALAWLLRANKLVGIPLVWISNPLTIWIYYPGYWLGCKLLGIEGWEELKNEWAMLEASPTVTWGARIQFGWSNFLEFVRPLSLGSLIIATVAGILSYYIALFVIRRYRLKRWGQLMPPSLTPIEDEADDGDDGVRPDHRPASKGPMTDSKQSGESAA